MSGTRKLGRATDCRRAMLRAMVTYLLENGKIETTVTRAKEVRAMAEKMITVGKNSDLHSKRQVYAFVTKEAVAKRILDLCQERNMAINALATISGVSPSTIYSMLNEKSKNPGVVSLKKICDGLEISLRDFFDCDLFDDLEQEIK